MYTYGYETSCRTAEEAEAPVCSGDGAGADRLMRRSLRYGSLPIISCLERLPYSTIRLPATYHHTLYIPYTATTALLTVISNNTSSLAHLPTGRPAIRASQQLPAALPGSISNHSRRSTVTCRYIIDYLVRGVQSRDHRTQTCLLSWQVLARACTISPP